MENKRNGHARVAAAPLLPRRRRHCRNRCAAPSFGLHSPANACSPLWSHQHIPHPLVRWRSLPGHPWHSQLPITAGSCARGLERMLARCSYSHVIAHGQ